MNTISNSLSSRLVYQQNAGTNKRDVNAEAKPETKAEAGPSGAEASCNVSISAKAQRAQACEKPVAAVEATKVTSSEPLNPFAATIVSMIEAQLQRDVADGAGVDALQSRLQAGLDGFRKGFSEAMAQLEGNPQFTGAVRAEIDMTEYQVLKAINELAEKLGLEPPVATLPPKPAAPDASEAGVPPAVPEAPGLLGAVAGSSDRTLDSNLKNVKVLLETLERTTLTYEHLAKSKRTSDSEVGYRASQERSFTLNLKTQDGDTVTLAIQSSNTRTGAVGASGAFGTSMTAHDRFQFEVDGDLDEGELRAISDLLNDINKLATDFYQGDYADAIKQALSLNFDSSELSAFELNIQESWTERVESSSQASETVSPELVTYAQGLLAQAEHTVQMGFKVELITDFLEQWELIAEQPGASELARQLFDRNGFDLS